MHIYTYKQFKHNECNYYFELLQNKAMEEMMKIKAE